MTRKKIKQAQITTANSNENLNSTIVTEKIISEKTQNFCFVDKDEVYNNKISNIIVKKNNFKFIDTKTRFSKKAIALEYIEKHKDKKLYLFSEDLFYGNGEKSFIVATKEEIFEVSKNKIYYLYENYTTGQKARLVFDIDIDLKTHVIPTEHVDKRDFQTYLSKYFIDLTNKELKLYTKVKPKIIILTANTDTKLSAHIIYQNIVFEDVYVMGNFVGNLKIDPSFITGKKKIFDTSIYADRCLRLLWNSKFGKNNLLEAHDFSNYYYTSDENLFYDSMILPQNNDYTLIKYQKKEFIIKKSDKKILKNEIINDNTDKIINSKVQKKIVKVPLEEIQKYVNLLDLNRCTDYKQWLNVGYMIHNCNSDGFSIWDNWSKNSPQYNKNEAPNRPCDKWKTFNKVFDGLSYLKFYAKKDNPEEYQKFNLTEKVPELLYDSVKFEKPYLLDLDEKLKDKSSIVAKNVCEWLEKDIKTLCLEAPYDSGKTQMAHKIITEFKFDKILIISYRQTLTFDLYGHFKKHNITCYLNGFENIDRIICQVDSLPKLIENLFDDVVDIPKYDLIIIDESESVISQCLSDLIKDKLFLFDFFQALLSNSKKILLLDGDFGDRSFEFIKDLGNNIVLQNNYKKCNRHYIFTNDQLDFENRIDNDLKNKKNIVIVSMSSTVANEYYKKYEKTYKSVLHCADSDDSIKKKLIDVNSYWSQFQLVIYSPTISAGVSYDKVHFDEMYIILSKQSVAPRDLLQMMSRCRKIKNKNSYVLINGFPFYENSKPYVYKEVECHVHSIYTQYLVKSIGIKEDGTKTVEFKNNLFTKMLVYHEMENLNKQPFYFISVLLKLIIKKGGTYEYVNNKTKNEEKIYFKADEIIGSNDISEDNFQELLLNKKKNIATHIEKLQIEKYIYKYIWQIDEINEEFMKKFYQKTSILLNLRYLTDENINNAKFKNDCNIFFNNQHDIIFDECKKLKQKEIIINTLNLLGFNNIFSKIRIDRNIFVENIKILLKDGLLFKHNETNFPLFGLNRTCNHNVNVNKENEKKIIKSFLRLINCIFKEWGFDIKASKSSKNVNKKKINTYHYGLIFINSINNYL